MKILMTNNRLDERGGSESYLETVAPELRRLGAEVVLFSPVLGAVADRFRQQGFSVVGSTDEIPGDVDVVHGQHSPAVAQVRQRLPEVPLVFVSHSWFVPIEDPAPELRPAALVAFNDRVEARLRAFGLPGAAVHRLRQPVGISYAGGPPTPPADEARSLLVVSRRMRHRLGQVEQACARAGIAVTTLRGESADPRPEMQAADIVVASGRTALEAMALGRAVLLLDETVVGGWVDESSWASFEALGFALAPAGTEPDLAALLAAYSPALGASARTLAVHHHAAQDHAAQLLEIYRSVLGDRTPSPVSDRLPGALAENFDLGFRLRQAETAEAATASYAAGLEAHVADLEALLAETQAELHFVVGAYEEAKAETRQLQETVSWRLTAPLRAVRRLFVRRRGPGG